MSSPQSYTVHGMSCGGCAGKVADAAASVPGVTATDVELATDTVRVTGSGVEPDVVRRNHRRRLPGRLSSHPTGPRPRGRQREDT